MTYKFPMFSFIETKLFSQLREDYLPDEEYAKVREGVLFMLTIYAKNEEDNIPAHILRKITEEIDA